jgi:hypothetical protein
MERKGLREMRKNLQIFIDADWRDIWIERPTKQVTDAGSWIEGQPENLPPQRCRIVPGKRRRGDTEVDSQDGNIPISAWDLVCPVDMDIRRDDEFVVDDNRYKVIQVAPDTTEREFTDRVVAQLEMSGKADT